MIRPELIDILCCPETMQRVREMTDEERQECNRRIAAREVSSRIGVLQTEPIASGLIREDGALVFPIVGDIPVMLLEEALVLS